MPFDENGFLGKEALRMAEQIKTTHREFLNLCYEINSFAQRLKSDFEIHEDPQEFLAACFFIRILEGAQAAIVLVERGLELETSTILRSMFEALVYLKRCVNEVDFPKKYMQYGEIKSLDNLKAILHYKLYEKYEKFEGEEGTKKMISEIEERFSSQGINIGKFKSDFSKKKNAENAGMLELYNSFYSVTSDSAHTGLGALEKHLPLNEDGKIIEIAHGPSDKEAGMHLTAIAEFILYASRYACDLFKIDRTQEIEKYHKQLKEINSRLDNSTG